jgi:Ni/Co efflux regulator RcnB
MKYVMTAALALSLMASGAAFAQEHRDEHGGGGRPGGGEPHGTAPHGGGGPHGPPPGAPQQHGQLPGSGGGPRPGGAMGGPRPGGAAPVARPEAQFTRPQGGGGPRPGPGPGRPGGGRPAGAAFNGRPGSFLSSRNWRPAQRFRGPSYHYPRGYGYQRWAFGAFLPALFLAPDYTLSDYWTYGLPAPPPGYHWIRVGPDALLVRYGDGYVLDAAYGLFY